jgi:hypothetical protein
MVQSENEKKRLIEQLAKIRVELNNHAANVREDLNVNRRISASIRKHPWSWLSIAAILGWLLSRLPARKKKIYIHTSSTSGKLPKKRGDNSGLALHAWKAMWLITKPLLTAYLAKKLA